MKAIIYLLFFALTSSFASSADNVAKTGVVFTDGASFEVDFVGYGAESEGTYLARIKGAEGVQDGTVFKLTKNGGGTGASYYAKEDGTNLLRAPAHAFFGWEAYVGNATYKINKDNKLSKELNTADLLKDFKKQGKK
jgi:hypothetical protein